MNLYRAGANIKSGSMAKIAPCDLCGMQFAWPEFQVYTVCLPCWISK
jgi:hypothetical protein